MTLRPVAHLALGALFAGAAIGPAAAQNAADFKQPAHDGKVQETLLGTEPQTRIVAPRAPNVLGQLPRTARLEAQDHAPRPLLAALRPDGPKLGVQVQESADGVTIVAVQDDSLARSAGMQPGDIILRVGDARISDIGDIKQGLADFGPGDAVPLTVVRAGKGLVRLEGHLARPKPAPHQHAEGDHAEGAHEHGGAFLGVELGEETRGGIEIAGIVPDSSAWFAGLQEGDLLVRIGKHDAESRGHVAELIAAHAPGNFVRIEYTRDGEAQQTRARLSHQRSEAGPGLLRMLAPEGNRLRLPAPSGRDGHTRWLDLPGGGNLGLADPDNKTLKLWRQGDNIFHLDDEDGTWAFSFDGEDSAFEDMDFEDLHSAFEDMDLEDLHSKLKGIHLDAGENDFDFEQLGEWMHGIDAGGAEHMRIEIEDGVMRIERDGEVEEIELDGDDHAGVQVIELKRSSNSDGTPHKIHKLHQRADHPEQGKGKHRVFKRKTSSSPSDA